MSWEEKGTRRGQLEAKVQRQEPAGAGSSWEPGQMWELGNSVNISTLAHRGQASGSKGEGFVDQRLFTAQYWGWGSPISCSQEHLIMVFPMNSHPMAMGFPKEVTLLFPPDPCVQVELSANLPWG